jgi:hypothetical protein
VAAPEDGYPRSEASRHGQRLSSSEQETSGVSSERATAGKADDPNGRKQNLEQEGEWML